MPEELPQDAPLNPEFLERIVATALDEDLGPAPGRDVTTQATIPSSVTVEGVFRARADGVVAGLDAVTETLRQVAGRLGLEVPETTERVFDGERVEDGVILVEVEGPGHVVLIAERTALNLVSRASGIATHTQKWTDALEGTGARVLDTRKTTPGLRELEKYAVRCGGGVNKRMGLFDCAMVKDNHIVAAGTVTAAVLAIQARFPDVPIQVEVETWEQAQEALAAGVRFLMLDNLSPAEMTEFVERVRGMEPQTGKVWLEATGGLTLATARVVAETGVDFMSVGGLTHSSPILDVALDLI
ncbi:carboxylating nicotinate-nucleotide diphosphorylase [Demequina sp.]|uniref:carboxylating nicotinate-nucleotide diphosphorylase n=1 Tax=Demequina sp. TaxID=2050685 RepID=UPI003D0EBC17